MVGKVRVGIIGTSLWTDLMYVPSFSSHGQAEVVAISGRNAERAAEIARKFGSARVFTDYRQLITSGEIDAVVVATPDNLHYEMTMAALDAGLHVLCEKPLANNAVNARAMRDAAIAAGVKNMVLFTWRWQPHWRYVKHLIDTNYIGACRQARFDFIGGYALDKGYKWRFDGRRANGVTGDNGSHMIDFAQWYLGDIARVWADLLVFTDQSRESEPPPVPVNDAGLLALEFLSGARAQIQVSAVALVGDEGLRVTAHFYGDAGTIEAEHIYFGVDAGVTLRGVRQGEPHFNKLTVPEEFFEGGVRPSELLDPYSKQSVGPRLFVDAILEDKPAIPDFSVAVRVQEVVDAALLSSAEKCWIALI